MPSPKRRTTARAAAAVLGVIGMTLAASACAGGTDVGHAPDHPDDWPGVTNLPDPDDVYDPIAAGETTPDGFRQAIPRDGIRPIYVPTFVAADEAGWPDEELVIGVDLAGEARAYPVGFLTRREVVNDMHRGIPTFVTW